MPNINDNISQKIHSNNEDFELRNKENSFHTILVVFPYRFREFDRKRFEIECLKRYTNVIMHELIDALHPHFSSSYHEFDKSKDVIRFSSILSWRKVFLNKVKRSNGNLYVINFVSVTTFKELFVNYVLSSSGVFLIGYDNTGVSTYGNIPKGFFSKIRTKYNFIIKRASFKWATHTILTRVIRILNLLLCQKSDVILSVDKTHNKFSKKVIAVNSFDYSMAIKFFFSYESENKSQNTIVFLDSGGPLFKTDSFMFGNKHPLTTELWYPSLVNFFNILENKTGRKVVIAAHPKHSYSSEHQHYFGNRTIVHGETMDLVSQASLVLVTDSTAVSYAIMFNKPILVLLSNEIINDNNIFFEQLKYLSSILGSSTVNIDKIDKKLLSNFPIDSEKYLAYKNRYLSSRNDNKTNCEIIISEIINEQSVVNNGMQKT